MTAERDTTRIVRSWLEEGVTALPDRVLDTVLDQLPTTRQRRPWGWAWRVRHVSNPVRYAIAAAAVLLVAIVGFRVLMPVSDIGPPRVTGSPTPTSSAAPTAMVIPAGGQLVQGTYVQTSIEPLRITFTVPSGGWQVNVVPEVMWTANSDGRFSFGQIDNLYVDPCDPGLGVREPPVGPTVEDLATALANLPGLDPVTPTDVSVSGFAGKLVEINAPATDGSCGSEDLSLFPLADEAAPLDREAIHSFYIVDVRGTRLVIHTVARAPLPQVWRNELQQIVDSVRIE